MGEVDWRAGIGYQEGERGRTGIGPATHQHGHCLQAGLSEQSTKHRHLDPAIRCLVHVATGSLVDPTEVDEDGSNKQETNEMGEDLVGCVLERG